MRESILEKVVSSVVFYGINRKFEARMRDYR